MEKNKFVTPHISRIEIKGLWGKYDLELDLKKDINIIFGENGSGKTAIIELVYAVLFQTNKREKYKFREVILTFSDGTFYKSQFVENPKNYVKNAIRNLQEEIKTQKKEGIFDNIDNIEQDYNNVYYEQYSVKDTNEKIHPKDLIQIVKINTFEFFINEIDEKTYYNKKEFSQLDIKIQDLQNKFKDYLLELDKEIKFEAKQFDDIIINIPTQFTNEDYNFESSIPFEYKEALKEKKEFKELVNIKNIRINKINYYINLFYNIIKKYFEGELNQGKYHPINTFKNINTQSPESLEFILKNDFKKIDFKQLSSGEKQLVLIFLTVLLQKGEPSILLLDEPEISLHITWQEELIKSIRELNPNCQLIITTHSPDLCIGFGDYEIDLISYIKNI